MTDFDEVFFDLCGYRPPSPRSAWAERAANVMVLLLAGLFLLTGWLFKDFIEHQLRYLSLSEVEVAVPYPANWRLRVNPPLVLDVVRPIGSRTYPAREEVLVLPLPQEAIPDFWLHQRQQLDGFRLQQQNRVTLASGREAYLLEYTYIAASEDPHFASFVPVRAFDLVFPAMYGSEERLVIVTLAAESQEWPELEPTFRQILAEMGVGD